MNKKKALLLITSLSLVSGAMAVVFVSNNLNANASAPTKSAAHSLTISNQNFGLISNRYYRTMTPNGNLVKFFCSGQYGSMPQNSFLRFSGSDILNIEKEQGNYHAITGIESISVNYLRCNDYITAPKVTEAGQPGDLTVQFGYINGENAMSYGAARSLSSGEATDLSDISPRYFKITKAWNTGNVNCAIYIQSITINYSCSSSVTDDSVLTDVILSSYNTSPSFDYPNWTATFGLYPQSLASNSDDLETLYQDDITYETPLREITGISSGYYYINGKLYCRKIAESTGYNDEYVSGNPYWFNVEPVKWYVQDHYSPTEYNRDLLMPKVLLDSRVFDTDKTVDRYGADSATPSQIHDYLEGDFCEKVFPKGSSYIYQTTKAADTVIVNGNNRNGRDALSNCTVYLPSEQELRRTDYWGKKFSASNDSSDTRRFPTTDYFRASGYNNGYYDKDGIISAEFWLRCSYNYLGICTRYGQMGTNFGNVANENRGIFPVLSTIIYK